MPSRSPSITSSAARTPGRGRSFVLVHGMSHGAWCWDALRDHLERAGHRVLAVDLPGHGPRAHEWRRATLDRYAAAVAGAMAREAVHDAVLVGHSMGGVVIQKAAELVEPRLSHLVFLAAVVLPHDSSLLRHHLPPAGRAVFQGLAAAGGGAVRYPASMAHARWMSDLPAGDPRIAHALAHLTAQPARPWTERVDLRRFFALPTPRTYVRCLRDAAVPPARAAEYAARLGVVPIDLDCVHGPALSQPETVARILTAL
jgi:pimeloyl-ACP methyl ester carboxylesterase